MHVCICVRMHGCVYINYVVRYVLEQVPQYRHNIINIIAQSIIQLSRQKFSSNVVEKCLQLASPEGQALMVTSLAHKEQVDILNT